MSQKETRTYKGRVELRKKGGKLTLTGHAAVFNSPTRIDGFDEVVRPGAFTKTLLRGDALMLWNHDPSRPPLGRVSAGTLRLAEDDRGLRVELDPPTSASDIVEAVERRDVTGMSFGFTVPKGGDRWTERNGRKLRELLEVNLIETSIVVWPAYAATEISAEARKMVRNWNSDLARRRRELDEMEAEMRAERQREFARMRAELARIS